MSIDSFYFNESELVEEQVWIALIEADEDAFENVQETPFDVTSVPGWNTDDLPF